MQEGSSFVGVKVGFDLFFNSQMIGIQAVHCSRARPFPIPDYPSIVLRWRGATQDGSAAQGFL
jgi:hypothetical protein